VEDKTWLDFQIAQEKAHGLGVAKVLEEMGVDPAPLIKQAECLDENRIVLYKKGRQMGNGYYIVEISSNNSCMFIAAYDVESPESLLIELNETKAEEIMKEFSNDYETMASCLQIMNRRLVLLNPKYNQLKN
jgi:hypothetical protein